MAPRSGQAALFRPLGDPGDGAGPVLGNMGPKPHVSRRYVYVYILAVVCVYIHICMYACIIYIHIYICVSVDTYVYKQEA